MNNKFGFLPLIIVLLFNSCINSVSKEETEEVVILTNSKLTVVFPDKPVKNSSEIGEIYLESDIDTIKLNSNVLKMKTFYVGAFKKKHTLEEYKKMSLDSFVVLKEKKVIPFTLTFEQEGEFYLGGYYRDLVLLKNHYKDGSDKLLSIESEVNKKVTVVKNYTIGDEDNDKIRALLRFHTKNKINKEKYGEIIYKSYLDTIRLTDKDIRSVIFYFDIFDKEHVIPELEGKTSYARRILDDKKVIPFNVTFHKEGEFILDGYVEDIVFLGNYYKDGNSRMITKQTKISKKVTVVKE